MLNQKKKILLLPVSAGMGHIKAAEALQGVLEEHEGVEVENLDCLEYSKFLKGVYHDWYRRFMNSIPEFYGAFYTQTATPRKIEKFFFKPKSIIERLSAGKLFKKVKAFDPDMIVSFHPLPAEVVSFWLNNGKIDAKHFVVLTDFVGHRTWAQGQVDSYFVNNDELKNFMIKQGVELTKILNTGIPINKKFTRDFDEEEFAFQQKLTSGKKKVLIHLFAFTKKNALRIVEEELLKLDVDAEFILLCGKNTVLFEQVEKLINGKENFKIVGFTEEMYKFMQVADVLLCKPGGLILSEAMAKGLPFVTFGTIPGQEVGNNEFVLERGAALSAPTVESVGQKIKQLLTDETLYQEKKDGIAKLAKPKAAFDIAQVILK